MKWRPIDTAQAEVPDRGFVICWDGEVTLAQRFGTKWYEVDGDRTYPTHWMPLPDPPEPTEAAS